MTFACHIENINPFKKTDTTVAEKPACSGHEAVGQDTLANHRRHQTALRIVGVALGPVPHGHSGPLSPTFKHRTGLDDALKSDGGETT